MATDRDEGIREMRTTLKTLRDLYSQIPAFSCPAGCSDCCGPVPFSKTEWAMVADKRMATDLKCPYAGVDGCEIYSFRPFICRLFGASVEPLLRCPKGFGPHYPLSSLAARKLLLIYHEN